MKGMVIVLILGLFLISGCQTNDGGSGTYSPVSFDFEKEVKTKQFHNADELLSFIKTTGTSRYSYYTYGAKSEESLGVLAGATQTLPTPVDYSKTNVQVEEVDEADIIKTDGNYIYTVSGKTLYIVKAYPGEEAGIVSTINFSNEPESLFILGDKLAVFGNFYDNEYFKEINFRPLYGMTFFSVYDINDKKNPELEKEYKFEGNYFRARMTGDYVYFITSTTPQYRIDYPTPIVIRENARLSAIPLNNVFYYDINYNSPVFVNVHAINLKNPSQDVSSASVVVESSQNMYMSEENIYVTYTDLINEYELMQQVIMELLEDKLTDADRELIEKIKTTDNEVLSKYEKDAKIMQVYQVYIQFMTEKEEDEFEEKAEELLSKKLEEFKYLEFTVINKIHVDGAEIEPVANSKVPGHIINQFSLDEKGSTLRIATTISARWSRFDSNRTESLNNVYALDGELKELGKLEGLAEGEQIYSTRFMGDRLYMVTFRQVDPFFVIDLSDPSKIKELGKLKIPGFSRYLHPYDEDTIIGIGKDVTETGRTEGLKVSLFDVSDVENPKEIAKYVGSDKYAESTALYEHKAFLFSKDKELLVIPVYYYNYRDENAGYNGAFVFRINKKEVTLRGLIDHSSASRYYWQPAVERSLYIEELLYTKSEGLLRINKIEDLSSVKSIPLNTTTTNIPIY